jgi:nicotinamide-nucleotide amidase
MNESLGSLIVRRAESLGGLLREQRLLLTTAESCTAGGIAYAVTSVAGSSAWFERGFVTYSNESKLQVLGVSPVYMRDFGAVSEPVARSMALGALSHSAAQAAIAVTGIAGPDGATPDKSVGTICFAWAIRRRAAEGFERAQGGMTAPWVRTATRHFEGDRAAVRAQAIVAALEGQIALLEQRQDV